MLLHLKLLETAEKRVRNDALREALGKVRKVGKEKDTYANVPSEFTVGIETACEEIEADILALIKGE